MLGGGPLFRTVKERVVQMPRAHVVVSRLFLVTIGSFSSTFNIANLPSTTNELVDLADKAEHTDIEIDAGCLGRKTQSTPAPGYRPSLLIRKDSPLQGTAVQSSTPYLTD